MKNKTFALLAALLLAGFACAQPSPPQPHFVIGVWYQPPDSFDKWVSRGVNTLVGCETQGLMTPAEYVAKAHAKGLRVVGADPSCDVVQVLPDEPDNAGATTPAAWTTIAAKARTSAPAKLLFGNFDGWAAQYKPASDYAAYFAPIDLIGFDYYPLNRGDGANALVNFKARLGAMRTLAGQKPVWAFIETADQDLRVTAWAKDTTWGPALAPAMRGPTLIEWSNQVKASLDGGAAAIVYFPDVIGLKFEAYDGTPADIANAMPALAATIRARFNDPPVAPPSPTTGPAEPTTQPTTAPTTQAVPPPTLAWMHTRILCDANLTPIYGPNPAWTNDHKIRASDGREGSDPDAAGNRQWIRNGPAHDYLASLGCEEAQMIYNGTLNRFAWWAGRKDLDEYLRLGPDKPDGNFSDPPTHDACVALGQLAKNPDRFGGSARPHCPIMFDIEGTQVFTTWPGDTLAAKQKYVQSWINAVKWVKEGAGADQEVWIYGHVPYVYAAVIGDDPNPDPSLLALLRQLANQTTAAGATVYWWDVPVENRGGGYFHGQLTGVDTSIRRNCPEFIGAKVMTLLPVYQVYWPDSDRKDAAALDGTPVPFEEWRREVDWCVAHGYWIWLWTGNVDPALIRQHLAYAAQYGLFPKGDAAKWTAAAARN